jgi:hypothetical protein
MAKKAAEGRGNEFLFILLIFILGAIVFMFLNAANTVILPHLDIRGSFVLHDKCPDTVFEGGKYHGKSDVFYWGPGGLLKTEAKTKATEEAKKRCVMNSMPETVMWDSACQYYCKQQEQLPPKCYGPEKCLMSKALDPVYFDYLNYKCIENQGNGSNGLTGMVAADEDHYTGDPYTWEEFWRIVEALSKWPEFSMPNLGYSGHLYCELDCIPKMKCDCELVIVEEPEN